MSLTKIGSIGINTGIAFAGVTTIVTLNTANDALSIGATVNVGSGITLGASGDIFATGVSTFSGNLKVGSGVTISPDGDGFYTGVVTATTFSGTLSASNLTGALPAISGANLTNLDASDLASGTVPTARLGSGTASSSTFLRGDSTFQTVNTDLVSDTSPQLGGNLDTNDKNIVFGDSDGGSGTDNRAVFGTNSDLSIYHDGSHSYITHNGTGNFYVQTSEAATEDLFLQAGNDVYIRPQTGENGIKVVGNGAVELYHDNSKKFETSSTGNEGTGVLKLISGNGSTSSDDNILHIVSGGTATRGIKIGTGRATGSSQNDGMGYIDAIDSESSGYGAQIQLRVNAARIMNVGYQANKYVGINEDDPGYELVVAAQDANESTLQILSGGDGKESNILFGAPDDADVGAIKYDHNGDHMKFITGTTERFRVNSNGICLGGTGSSNGLDDYEEGTAAPTQVNGSFSPTNTDGRYTKIGRLVTWMISISFDSTASGNQLRIGNFPFTSGGGRPGAAIVRYSNDDEAFKISFHVDAGSATASAYYSNGGGTVASSAVAQKRFDLTFVYEAA